jgi:hypothetical protein
MTVTLPDLGATFTAEPVTAGNPSVTQAAGGTFAVTPGVYVLSATGPVTLATMPKNIGEIDFAEYHAPPADTVAPAVESLVGSAILAGRDAELPARIVDATPPDSATLYLRPAAGGFYRGYSLKPASGYRYAASVPAAALREGPAEYVITLFRGDSALTFPGGIHGKPYDWDFPAGAPWKVDVVDARTPVTLFDPGPDASRLAFSRIGDAGRRGLFRVGLSPVSGRPVFHLELPVSPTGGALPDYTASLVIKDRIAARRETIAGADAVSLRLRGLGAHQVLHLTLMESDGTSWTTTIAVDSAWTDRTVPLSAFGVGRGVLLPEGFPGEWNYWVGPAAGRGGAADHPRLDQIERLQFSLRRDEGVAVTPGGYGVEVESIVLHFGASRP